MPLTSKRGLARPAIVKRIFVKVKGTEKRILFPESLDERILRGCEFLAQNGLLVPVLLGSTKQILHKLEKLGLTGEGFEIVDTKDCPDYTKDLVELRSKKGMTTAKAKKLLALPMYVGTMLLKDGLVDGVISGATHPTADTLRPALQIIGLADTKSWASSYFLMIHEKTPYFFADCAFNIDPTAEQLAQIAISTHDSAAALGIKPKVAMLSFSTKGSAKDPKVDKIVKATKIVKKLRRDIKIDGELQFDAAVVPAVAKSKAPGSVIKGDANVLIFPTLAAGNIGYKIAQRFAHDLPIGPIVQGLAKPINDLSRGCTVEEVIEVGAMTALQALRFGK